MNSLYELTYNQESLARIFEKLNISEENLQTVPWSIGDAVMNNHGQMIGYITENNLGGIDILDPLTNVMGRVTSAGHADQIWGQNMDYLGDLGIDVDGNLTIRDLFFSDADTLANHMTDLQLDMPDVDGLDTLTSWIDFI